MPRKFPFTTLGVSPLTKKRFIQVSCEGLPNDVQQSYNDMLNRMMDEVIELREWKKTIRQIKETPKPLPPPPTMPLNSVLIPRDTLGGYPEGRVFRNR